MSEPRTDVARIEKAATNVEASAHQLTPLVWGVLVLLGLVLVAVLVVGYQNQRLSRNLDEIDSQVMSLRAENVDLRTQVDELNRFVEELQETTPEEQARNDAVNSAVSQVPAIQASICELANDLGVTLEVCL